MVKGRQTLPSSSPFDFLGVILYRAAPSSPISPQIHHTEGRTGARTDSSLLLPELLERQLLLLSGGNQRK